jgi:hypothetical protein
MNIKRALTLACMTVLCATVAVTAASARECKKEAVIAEGSIKSLRDLEAYPSSLFAWRAAVKEKFGGEWNSWRGTHEECVFCEFDAVCPRDRGEQAEAKETAIELRIRCGSFPFRA